MPYSKILLFVLFIGLLASTPASASFRIKKVAETNLLLTSLPQASPASSVVPKVERHLTFGQKMKQAFLVRKLMKEAEKKGSSGSAGLSIASFCLGVGGDLMMIIGLVGAVTAGAGVSALLGIFLLGLLAIVGGFVTGIMALVRKQRLKGLAITGVVIGGMFLFYLVVGIIAAASFF